MRKTLLIIIYFLLISNCVKETKKVVKHETKQTSYNERNRKTFFDFYFPDTVHIDKTYDGLILYKSYLDTLTPKIYEERDTMRLLSFHLVKMKNDTYIIDFKDIIESEKADVFAAKSKDSIPFKVKFEKTGEHYLEGVLKDEVYYATQDQDHPLEILRKFKHVKFPVFVTDDKSVIDTYGSFLRSTDNEDSELLFYKN